MAACFLVAFVLVVITSNILSFFASAGCFYTHFLSDIFLFMTDDLLAVLVGCSSRLFIIPAAHLIAPIVFLP